MEDFEQIHFNSYVSNRTNQNKDYSQAFEQEVQQRGFGNDGFMSQIGEPQAVAKAEELVAPKQTITEEQLLHIENGEFAKQSKILHRFFEGEQFEGSDQEAVQYGLDVMGEFTFNFAGMPVTTLFEGESEANPGGTLAQAASLIFSGTKQDAKAFLHVMDRYDMLPNISQNGMKRMLRGLGNDPSVWGSIASGGVGLLAKKFGIDATKGTIRSQLTNLAAAPAKLAMEKPIPTSAVVSGGITGVSDVATQGVEIAAGEEASPIDRVKRALFSTAIGTAAGAAIPTTLAAVGKPLADVAGQAARDAAPLVGKTLDAIEGAGDAAKARMADADGSVTLGMNIDPDPAIAAAGDAVKAMRGGVEAPELNASLKLPTETEPGIIAFHGSGADFDEFLLKYIGTGEGAQAYGYGLYFAEKEDIAKVYKNMMQRSVDIDGRPYIRGNQMNSNLVDEDIADDLGATNGDLEAAIKNSEEFLQEMIADDNVNAINSTSKELEKLKALRGRVTVKDQEGKLYKVGLEPKPEDMMDYQLPIVEQNPKFLKAFKEIYHDRIKSDPQLSELYPTPDSLTMKDMGLFDKSIVGQTYKTFAQELFNGDEASLTQALLEKGIPGIKYRDAGSRGGAKSLKDASFNYVIFDDKMIKILEKYGIVGPVAITGVAATQQKGDSDGNNT